MTEFQLQCECVKHLEDLVKQGKVLYFTSIPNSTFTTSWSQKRKNSMSGLRGGLPDLFIVLSGIEIWVELKTEKGVLSIQQKQVIKILNRFEFDTAFICCSLEEFKILIADALAGNFYHSELKYWQTKFRGAKMLRKLMEK